MVKRIVLAVMAIPFFMACDAPTTGTEMYDGDNGTERDEGLPERTEENGNAEQEEPARPADSENR